MSSSLLVPHSHLASHSSSATDAIRDHGSQFRKGLLLDGTSINQAWDVVCEYEEIVFAYTTPEQKLQIVNEFMDRDNVAAVTWDGVNDAPAL